MRSLSVALALVVPEPELCCGWEAVQVGAPDVHKLFCVQYELPTDCDADPRCYWPGDMIGCLHKKSALGAAEETVQFVLEAERSNVDHVERVALAVRDPTSPDYGKFRTQAQLDALTAPRPQHVAQIRAFLEPAQCDVTEVKGRRFEATCPVHAAATLFQTAFRPVANAATGQKKLRAGAYSVPEELSTMVVFGLHGLPLPPKDSGLQADAS